MIRRVVTGIDEGTSVFVSDGVPQRTHSFTHTPGMEWSFAWKTDPDPTVGRTEGEVVTPQTTLIPPVGGTRFLFMKVPPDSAVLTPGFDPAAAGAEMFEQQPDMAATFEPDDPRFHTTDTIDYCIVLDGEITCELDDCEEVLLKRNDVLVQAGTRHAWRNKSDRTALLAIVLVGASRDHA